MSEVEKMYENAGVKFIIGVHCKAKTGDGCKSRCPVCDYNTKPKEYPPFTAEKQIELIKWLAGFWVHINNVGGQINISTGGGYVSYYAEDLADAIALYINSKWDNLTESEQEQIRSILNG